MMPLLNTTRLVSVFDLAVAHNQVDAVEELLHLPFSLDYLAEKIEEAVNASNYGVVEAIIKNRFMDTPCRLPQIKKPIGERDNIFIASVKNGMSGVNNLAESSLKMSKALGKNIGTWLRTVLSTYNPDLIPWLNATLSSPTKEVLAKINDENDPQKILLYAIKPLGTMAIEQGKNLLTLLIEMLSTHKPDLIPWLNATVAAPITELLAKLKEKDIPPLLFLNSLFARKPNETATTPLLDWLIFDKQANLIELLVRGGIGACTDLSQKVKARDAKTRIEAITDLTNAETTQLALNQIELLYPVNAELARKFPADRVAFPFTMIHSVGETQVLLKNGTLATFLHINPQKFCTRVLREQGVGNSTAMCHLITIEEDIIPDLPVLNYFYPKGVYDSLLVMPSYANHSLRVSPPSFISLCGINTDFKWNAVQTRTFYVDSGSAQQAWDRWTALSTICAPNVYLGQNTHFIHDVLSAGGINTSHTPYLQSTQEMIAAHQLALRVTEVAAIAFTTLVMMAFLYTVLRPVLDSTQRSLTTNSLKEAGQKIHRFRTTAKARCAALWEKFRLGIPGFSREAEVAIRNFSVRQSLSNGIVIVASYGLISTGTGNFLRNSPDLPLPFTTSGLQAMLIGLAGEAIKQNRSSRLVLPIAASAMHLTWDRGLQGFAMGTALALWAFRNEIQRAIEITMAHGDTALEEVVMAELPQALPGLDDRVNVLQYLIPDTDIRAVYTQRHANHLAHQQELARRQARLLRGSGRRTRRRNAALHRTLA